MAQHADLQNLAAPQVISFSGQPASTSTTRPVEINGTNAQTGVTLNVTPVVDANYKITIKISSEFSELVNAPAPAIHVTRQPETTQLLKSRQWTLVGRQKIDNSDPPAAAENLLIFANASVVAEGLWKLK